uniref:Solute carrier organic anion transporter family member n=1 Tax=Ciona savignyi TaxID=51511 RepID=H2YLU4_CIOSA
IEKAMNLFELLHQVLAGTYSRSVLSSIERRFELPSTISAVVSSSYQIGNLTVMALVSYLGSKVNRPRFLAAGSLLLFIGYILVVLPQFLGDLYVFADLSTTSTSNHSQTFTCTEVAEITPHSTSCEMEEEKANSNMYIFIIVGMMVCGIGGAPTQPLGLSYVDDHASEHNSALYIGIITTITLVGPALGYLMGSFCLKIWVDFGRVDLDSITIDPKHQSWVGAWWLGFIVCIVVIAIASFPLWFFPKHLEKPEEKTKEVVSWLLNWEFPFYSRNKSNVEYTITAISRLTKLKKKMFYLQSQVNTFLPIFNETYSMGLGAAFARLFKNPQYICVLVIFTSIGFKIAGLGTFVVKYLEVAFGKSASQSSFLIGAINLPFLIIGTLLGSVIIKRWKLQKLGMVRLCICGFVLSFACMIPSFFIGCDTIAHAGLTVPYPTSVRRSRRASVCACADNLVSAETEIADGVESTCNSMCHCDQNTYIPVCGPANITYLSPCHAGCTDTSSESGKNEYTSCSCLGANGTSQSVTIGRCFVSNCEESVWGVIVSKSLSNFFSGMCITAIMILKMRTVLPQDKSFGIGIGLLVYRVLAAIPGPIAFGALIDSSCLFWSQNPCSNRSYCTVRNIV